MAIPAFKRTHVQFTGGDDIHGKYIEAQPVKVLNAVADQGEDDEEADLWRVKLANGDIRTVEGYDMHPHPRSADNERRSHHTPDGTWPNGLYPSVHPRSCDSLCRSTARRRSGLAQANGRRFHFGRTGYLDRPRSPRLSERPPQRVTLLDGLARIATGLLLLILAAGLA